MNILFISYDYPPHQGGIANVSYHMAQELNNRGDKLIVLAQKVKGDREFDKNNKFPTFRCINIFFLKELVLILLLPYFVLKYKIDIIYLLIWCQGGIATFLTYRFLNIPYVVHAHGAEFVDYKGTLLQKIKYGLFRRKYKRLIFRNAKRIIAVSNFTKGIVVSIGAEEDRVDVIYNGVDVNRFKLGLDTSKIILRHNLNSKKVLLTISRLEEYKGHDIVIKLMPELLQKIPNIVYIVVGKGGYREFLENIVKKLNLQQNVIFTGYVDETSLPLYYNLCDVYIMLTKERLDTGGLFEGFGLTFLEANSCCKPVIGARTGGISDAIVDGETGYLVDLDDSQEIIDKIVSLLENRTLADRLGREGRQRIIRENLTWESMGTRIQHILVSEIRGIKQC